MHVDHPQKHEKSPFFCVHGSLWVSTNDVINYSIKCYMFAYLNGIICTHIAVVYIVVCQGSVVSSKNHLQGEQTRQTNPLTCQVEISTNM